MKYSLFLRELGAISPNFSFSQKATEDAFKQVATEQTWKVGKGAMEKWAESQAKMVRSMGAHLHNPNRLYKSDPPKAPKCFKNPMAKIEGEGAPSSASA
eukprot:964271-Pyramimonas_sp.AAC.1